MFQETLNQSLAKAIFVSGSPLSMVEHPLWIEFFKKLRPSFIPPSRYRVASTYLDAQYTEMQAEVTSLLQGSKNLYLQCDGWSNLKNESIINFVICKPEPLFVDFIMTKSNRHTAPYLAELIINIIEKHGSEKFFVIIGDNASNVKAALTIVREKFPSIVTVGCLAHLLHLLCADILRCTTVKNFMANVVDIIKTVKKSHILQALFSHIQSEKKFKDRITLKLPGNTRWGSHLFCLQSFLSNKSVLQKLAVSEEADLPSDMKRRLLDDNVFWVRVQKMTNILKPIVDMITVIESNTPQIHNIFSKFNELESILKTEIPVSPLQKAEEKIVLSKFTERKEFGVSQIHLAADLLNPAVQGSKLSPTELIDAISFTCEVGQHMGFSIKEIRENVADYRDKDGLWRRPFIWIGVSENEFSPLLWWRSLRGTCMLADVAIRILGAPVTSAATERTFQTFSWIHNKKRNRLSTQRAAKLTYISHNWKLLNSDKPIDKKCKTNQKEFPTTNQQTQDNECEEDGDVNVTDITSTSTSEDEEESNYSDSD